MSKRTPERSRAYSLASRTRKTPAMMRRQRRRTVERGLRTAKGVVVGRLTNILLAMRILHIVTAFPRHAGDPIAPWLVELMHRLRARGHEIEVLASSYRGLADHDHDGIRVHR